MPIQGIAKPDHMSQEAWDSDTPYLHHWVQTSVQQGSLNGPPPEVWSDLSSVQRDSARLEYFDTLLSKFASLATIMQDAHNNLAGNRADSRIVQQSIVEAAIRLRDQAVSAGVRDAE